MTHPSLDRLSLAILVTLITIRLRRGLPRPLRIMRGEGHGRRTRSAFLEALHQF